MRSRGEMEGWKEGWKEGRKEGRDREGVGKEGEGWMKWYGMAEVGLGRGGCVCCCSFVPSRLIDAVHILLPRR